MMHRMHEQEFYGTVTVGERGQVVLPAQMRRDLGIEPGNRLLVMANRHGEKGFWRVMMVKGDVLKAMFADMSDELDRLMVGEEAVEE